MQQATQATDIKPSEVVLGYKIRFAFPARVRDFMLPPLDEDLIRLVRGTFNHTELTLFDAKLWAKWKFLKCSEGWDHCERHLAMRRIAALFAGEEVEE